MPLPVYEYRCTSGHRYEKTEGFDAPSRQQCRDCRAEARRQISLPAVIFKGSGFYSTDNRKSGGRRNGAPALSESSESSKSSNGNGHAHDDGAGHSNGADTKVEAAAAD